MFSLANLIAAVGDSLDFLPSKGTVLTVVGIIIGLWILLGVFKWLLRFYVKVDQGKALIINTTKSEPTVTFTGGIVLPVIHRAEFMDISVKTIEIDRSGASGLICKDNIRADIKVTFFVRVNNTTEAVMKVAQAIGCARASEQKTMEELFQAKFSEALKTVGRQLNFVELYEERTKFKEEILKTIGEDLNGYKLEDAAIDYLEQTPVGVLSKHNVLDSEGIKLITERTAQSIVKTEEFAAAQAMKINEIQRNRDKVIKQQDVDAREKILEMERQQADAELRQKREIEVIRAREEAEAKSRASEEFNRSEQARIKSEEEVAISTQNMQRQVQVAEKNRERVIGIETERVDRDRQLEALARERAVELNRIDKEKALEVERKNIQDVIRERVAVEKTVAEEEERIKDTRAFFTADRAKKVAITEAEQHAQASLVKDIKQAEAQEIAARHRSAEQLTMAQAELVKSQKIAEAKMKMAEGLSAEAAAEGLAKVKVKEADANAIEKVGAAEAKALLQKGTAEAESLRLRVSAEASGIESRGLAEGKAKQADAEATKLHLAAEAAGIEAKGLAEAKGREAMAAVTEKQGLADAVSIKEKLLAEAAGIGEKAEAMKLLSESTRQHEEFRLTLDKEKQVELAAITARKEVAEAQSHTMAEAFKSAKIDIVGGDGQFFDRFVNAVSGGKSVDAFVDNSRVTQALGEEYLSGRSSLIKDVKDVLAGTEISSEDLKNLSVAALLAKVLAQTSDEGMKSRIQQLLGSAKKLGLVETRNDGAVRK